MMQQIKHLISFSFLHFVSPDSTLDSSDGQNQARQGSSRSQPSSPSPPPPLPDVKPPPAASHSTDTETLLSSKPDDDDDDDGKDYKRVRKMAYNATLGVIAISVMVLMSIPHHIEAEQLNLYACAAAFACLSLITCCGVIYYSMANPAGKKLAWVQKRVMLLYGLLMVFAVLSRMAATYPLLHFLFMLLIIAAVIGLVTLSLYLGWQAEKKII